MDDHSRNFGTAYKTVHIYDQTYHLSGPDLAQIDRLANLVDSRMRAVAASGRTADSLRVAVLAALNLADELIRANDRLRSLPELTAPHVQESVEIRNRATKLGDLLDQIFEEEQPTGT